MKKTLVLSAIALMAAVPASANEISAGFNESSYLYGGIADKNYWGETEEIRRNNVLAHLNKVCASKRKSDQRSCAKAWKIINAAYADLQAQRTLQPSS